MSESSDEDVDKKEIAHISLDDSNIKDPEAPILEINET